MRKALAALAVATGIIVLWQPVITAAADPVTAAQHHPTTRVCPDNGKRVACFAIRRTDTVQPNISANVAPDGFGPADLRSAYNITTAGSSAMTVAVVDAFDDPNAESDLATYRSTFGLPVCTTANGCFRKVNQNGQASPLPATDTGWAGEISLDIDMVSAICPNCHILLVEAGQPIISDLGTGVNTAVNLGAKFISNSYGGPENGSENSYDTLYYNHPGVVITASSGDGGFGAFYPASGKGVTAVGGTSLIRDTSARGWSETVWNNSDGSSGSGCSGSVSQPAFQAGLTTGCSRRAEADVAAVADPQTGVAVYQTFGNNGWAVYGGTSAATPIIASIYALSGNPGAFDSANSYPYANPAGLNDVTSGSNGSCGAPLCAAGTGYDGPTGLGTPQGTSAFSARVTYATRYSSNINRNLSVALLRRIYQCDSTLPPNTFEPLLPQFNSGTRKVFLENILQVPGGDRPTYTAEFPCVKETDSSNNPLAENAGNLLTDDRQIEPYSISSWIAQVTNAVTDVHGLTLLGNINGVNSLMLNTRSPGTRPVFNVVPNRLVQDGPNSKAVFVGPGSQICTNTATIQQQGFAVNPDCGSTAIQTDANLGADTVGPGE